MGLVRQLPQLACKHLEERAGAGDGHVSFCSVVALWSRASAAALDGGRIVGIVVGVKVRTGVLCGGVVEPARCGRPHGEQRANAATLQDCPLRVDEVLLVTGSVLGSAEAFGHFGGELVGHRVHRFAKHRQRRQDVRRSVPEHERANCGGIPLLQGAVEKVKRRLAQLVGDVVAPLDQQGAHPLRSLGRRRYGGTGRRGHRGAEQKGCHAAEERARRDLGDARRQVVRGGIRHFLRLLGEHGHQLGHEEACDDVVDQVVR
mmetsp:Transcript_35492/g.106852  ORF Transcript_35492/g.106852 Transcript_35492/m.106852 type:complete len:260 (-) Transcript_35492:1192-1971(-)